MKVLIKVSGSVSAYKICDLISSLKKRGCEIKVAASPSALKFVGEASWEALSGNSVYTDDFARNKRLDHIYLNDWADVVVLAPATAKSLSLMSHRVGDSILTTLFLARKREKPYLIFPAMNPRMWSSFEVQKSVEILRQQKNIQLFLPDSGAMACGHEGVGRLKSVSEMADFILKSQRKGSKVLLSFGGTRESLDGVREISNFSSGKTGALLAVGLSAVAQVDVLMPESLQKTYPLEGIEKFYFKSSDELEAGFKERLQKDEYNTVIHMAAVSDYVPVKTSKEKIDSSQEHLEIQLKKRSKILNQIKLWQKDTQLVSFKLTFNQGDEVAENKIKMQFSASASDFIIHNKLEEISESQHPYILWSAPQGDLVKSAEGVTKAEMLEALKVIIQNNQRES